MMTRPPVFFWQNMPAPPSGGRARSHGLALGRARHGGLGRRNAALARKFLPELTYE